MSEYKRLDAWRQSMLLVREIYKLTDTFPGQEQYGLVSQLRRAVVSAPCNIAEGMGRQHPKDRIKFLNIARGSLYEVETLIAISFMLSLVDEARFNELNGLTNKCLQLTNGMTRYLERAHKG